MLVEKAGESGVMLATLSESHTAVGETSFNIDFLPNTKNRVGSEIAIPPPYSHDTKYYLNYKSS
jgi:hypothetical protein